MAVTASARLGITRWSAGADPFNRAQLDGDHATLDNLAAMDSTGTLAARPAAGIRGRYYFATDNHAVYRDTGTAWFLIGTNVLGYAQVVANQTGIGATATDLTGLASTVTVLAGRRIRVTGHVFGQQGGGVSTGTPTVLIQEGATIVEYLTFENPVVSGHSFIREASIPLSPSAGAHTYKLTMQTANGTVDLLAAANYPAWIMVQDIGLA